MHKLIKFLGASGFLIMPFMVMANDPVLPSGTAVGGNTVFNILGIIGGILNVIIPILITLAVIYIIYGVIKYATAKEQEDQSEGRRVIISGIIGLFVIVSIWGLVAILNATFGVNQGGYALDNPLGCIPVGYDWNLGQPILPQGC